MYKKIYCVLYNRMNKKCLNIKKLLLDVDIDENIEAIWMEPIVNKTYFNCGCCKKCLCTETTACINCGCSCNCIDMDDDNEETCDSDTTCSMDEIDEIDDFIKNKKN